MTLHGHWLSLPMTCHSSHVYSYSQGWCAPRTCSPFIRAENLRKLSEYFDWHAGPWFQMWNFGITFSTVQFVRWWFSYMVGVGIHESLGCETIDKQCRKKRWCRWVRGQQVHWRRWNPCSRICIQQCSVRISKISKNANLSPFCKAPRPFLRTSPWRPHKHLLIPECLKLVSLLPTWSVARNSESHRFGYVMKEISIPAEEIRWDQHYLYLMTILLQVAVVRHCRNELRPALSQCRVIHDASVLQLYFEIGIYS